MEFAKKGVAKRVAEMLNGQAMGGPKRSAYHYDLWNLKYLHKFKWDNLTEEIGECRGVQTTRMIVILLRRVRLSDQSQAEWALSGHGYSAVPAPHDHRRRTMKPMEKRPRLSVVAVRFFRV